MPSVQDWIHKFEQGSGRGPRLVFVVLVVALLMLGYNWRCFRNMGTQEAMDSAQVAHNLAQGRGFTTQFVRPFSIYLVKKHNIDRLQPTETEPRPDYAQLKGMHPDLANPPVYPLVLAGLMKVLPFQYEVNLKDPFWSTAHPRPGEETPPRMFARYQPDFLIGLFNQLLLVTIAVLSFFLARRLFDASVAWLSLVLVLCCELLWRFSVSGLSTMLLMLCFLSLIWCLVWIESEEREPVWSHRAQLWLALAIGGLLGIGTLTRYAFGWLAIPVLVYLGIFCAIRRTRILLLVVGTFLVVLTPWIWRNIAVSSTPFGTAGYAIVEGTFVLPENKLQRSLEPDFRAVGVKPFLFKLGTNSRQILQDELPRLGGSWMTALFLTGLLLNFRNPALQRLRYFLLATLLLFIIVQALGRTQLTDDSPVLNSENLLILTVPLIFVFGAGLFFLLLDQMNLKLRELRYLIIGVFGVVMCLPMFFAFLPPKVNPINYPPYYPPVIQQSGNWMKPNELIMSDIPWAVAWYGDRQCIWLTENAESEFFAVNDYLKPVRALYLTPETTDSRVLSEWIRPKERSWPIFVLEFMIRKQAPAQFPLRYAYGSMFPEQLFLTDFERWKGDPTNQITSPVEEDSNQKNTESKQ
ncbi:MAG TPA: glycosyltransferase family 39 protein [Verrucomicrobiae bacterium]|nr:glycosyltransferase family 39 protein [Verrucomicrobiae bacterium]